MMYDFSTATSYFCPSIHSQTTKMLAPRPPLVEKQGLLIETSRLAKALFRWKLHAPSTSSSMSPDEREKLEQA